VEEVKNAKSQLFKKKGGIYGPYISWGYCSGKPQNRGEILGGESKTKGSWRKFELRQPELKLDHIVQPERKKSEEDLEEEKTTERGHEGGYGASTEASKKKEGLDILEHYRRRKHKGYIRKGYGKGKKFFPLLIVLKRGKRDWNPIQKSPAEMKKGRRLRKGHLKKRKDWG